MGLIGRAMDNSLLVFGMLSGRIRKISNVLPYFLPSFLPSITFRVSMYVKECVNHFRLPPPPSLSVPSLSFRLPRIICQMMRHNLFYPSKLL